MPELKPLTPEEWAELRTLRQRGGRLSIVALTRMFITLDSQAAEIARLQTEIEDLKMFGPPDDSYNQAVRAALESEPPHAEPA